MGCGLGQQWGGGWAGAGGQGRKSRTGWAVFPWEWPALSTGARQCTAGLCVTPWEHSDLASTRVLWAAVMLGPDLSAVGGGCEAGLACRSGGAIPAWRQGELGPPSSSEELRH